MEKPFLKSVLKSCMGWLHTNGAVTWCHHNAETTLLLDSGTVYHLSSGQSGSVEKENHGLISSRAKISFLWSGNFYQRHKDLDACEGMIVKHRTLLLNVRDRGAPSSHAWVLYWGLGGSGGPHQLKDTARLTCYELEADFSIYLFTYLLIVIFNLNRGRNNMWLIWIPLMQASPIRGPVVQ